MGLLPNRFSLVSDELAFPALVLVLPVDASIVVMATSSNWVMDAVSAAVEAVLVDVLEVWK